MKIDKKLKGRISAMPSSRPFTRFSVSSAGTLGCSLRAASKLVSQKARLTQTSMLLILRQAQDGEQSRTILSFAESSSASEPIFARERGGCCLFFCWRNRRRFSVMAEPNA
jgi:hypothetical protein